MVPLEVVEMVDLKMMMGTMSVLELLPIVIVYSPQTLLIQMSRTVKIVMKFREVR
jgi:hypothetical protein